MKKNKEKIKNIIILIAILITFVIICRYDTYTYTSNSVIKEAQRTATENINSKTK